MSPRDTEHRSTLRRLCLTGAATAGVTAITVLMAGPAESAVRSAHGPAIASAAGAASSTARSLAGRHVADIPVPGKGNDTKPQAMAGPKDHAKKVPTVSEALKLALEQVGTTESAGGGTKFNAWFVTTPAARLGAQKYGGKPTDYANAAWCDMFISWIGDQLGIPGMGVDAFTPGHARWFQQQGRWGTTPKPGAVVFFSWDGGGIDGIDHVGMVVKDNGNGTIQTVEGNTDNAVKIRTRSTSTVVGYGYPQYAQ